MNKMCKCGEDINSFTGECSKHCGQDETHIPERSESQYQCDEYIKTYQKCPHCNETFFIEEIKCGSCEFNLNSEQDCDDACINGAMAHFKNPKK